MYFKATRIIIAIMKCFFYGVLVQCFLVNMLWAIKSDAQKVKSVKEVHIDLSFNNNSLIEVFNAIESQSNFKFNYSDDDVAGEKRINKNYQDATIAEVLIDISREAKLKFKQVNRNINVNRLNRHESKKDALRVTIKDVNISGKVTDENGQGLPGASVIVKGTPANGTVSNLDGYYKLNVNEGETLVVSFVGYKSQEVVVGGQSVIDISLSPDVTALDEIVVVGYGSQSRETITTSVSKLDDEVLENIPYSNAAQALEGTLAGVRVQTNSGQPGAAPNIIIRGGTSINNPNSSPPLYIIDGVYRNNMNEINTRDIASIQVLKDAAATAIYGAQGSNGVIIIETNSGKSGGIKVNYTVDYTTSKVGKKYDLLTGRDEVYFARLGLKATTELRPDLIGQLTASTYLGGVGNDLSNNTYSSIQYLSPENEHKLNEGWESMPDPVDPSKTLIFSSVDWQDILFRTAASQSHSATVSGGNERSKFYLGLGYQDIQGIAIETGYKRISLNFSGEAKVSDKVKLSARVMYANTNNNYVPSTGSVFKSSLIGPSTNKQYFEDGSFSTGRNFGYSNPFYKISTYHPKNQGNDLTVIISSEAKILPGLTFTPQISIRKTNSYARNFQEAYRNGPTNLVTSRNASASFSEMSSPQANGVFTYLKSFNDDHNVELKAGFTYFESNNVGISARGSNAATDIIYTLNASATPVSVSGSETEQVMIGYFSRASYNYKSKYLFNASLRYDGASNLGDNNKWGVFPGISVGWNVDRENFWDGLPENLLKLKLRASYGVTGNISGLGRYQAQGAYSVSSLYDGNAGIQITTLPNKDLRWEQSKTMDVGMDIGLFNNRIGILFDYYRRETSNLLTTLKLPLSTGFSSILTNYGSLENRGYEIEVSAQVLPATSPLKWNMAFNTADVKSKILRLPDNGVENNRVGGVYVYDPAKGDYGYLGGLQEGGRVGDLYGYQQESVYSTDAEAAEGPVDMLIPRTDKTKYGGDVNWLDLDENDTIDTRDRIYMGNKIPRITGGLTNSFSFKSFSMVVRMDYTLGATVYYENGARTSGNFSGANAINGDIRRSWQKQGDVTDVPRYYWADQNAQWNVWNSRGSSRFYQKTDFLCLREVTFAYSLPRDFLERIKIEEWRFHITGSNLIYFTDYDGLSPEQTNSDTAYPNPRSIILGASITF